MKEITKELTSFEASEYARCNQTIRNTKGSFIACGRALETIRDKKLYRQQYSSFPEYCEMEWGWGKSQAYRLIEASRFIADKLQVVQNQQKSVPHGGQSEVPETERATRKLIGKGKKRATPEPLIEMDKTGIPIPGLALKFWNRSSEIEGKLHEISKLRVWAKELQDSPDLMFAEVNMNGIYTDLCNVYRNLKQAVPYAVCPVCQGQAPDACALCKGRGVISKFCYDHAIPQETKDIRAKVSVQA